MSTNGTDSGVTTTITGGDVVVTPNLRTGYTVVGHGGRIVIRGSVLEDYMLTTINITNAQLLTIDASPVQVVSPVAGKVVWPLAAFFMVSAGTKPWAGGTNILLTTNQMATNGYAWIEFDCGWAVSLANGFVSTPLYNGGTPHPPDVVGQPLVLTVSKFSTPQPPSGGDAHATCTVAYEIVDPA